MPTTIILAGRLNNPFAIIACILGSAISTALFTIDLRSLEFFASVGITGNPDSFSKCLINGASSDFIVKSALFSNIKRGF